MGVGAWRGRLRRVADDALIRAHNRLHPDFPVTIHLDYPPSAEPGPRYGYDRPRHELIARVLGRSADTYRSELESFRAYIPDLLEIPRRDPGPGEPCWLNEWLPGLDTVALYSYVRKLAPVRYVEVGSGASTTVVHRARRDGELTTRISSIDPSPRRDIDPLCDELIREPLETVGVEVFSELEAGDVVFFDGSHRVFSNSDAAVFHLEVLPSLPDGVVVGIHDVLWPDDYLPELTAFWWSEQYVLGAYLLGGAEWLHPLLACSYVAADPELASILGDLWREPKLREVDRRGFAFWTRIDASKRPF